MRKIEMVDLKGQFSSIEKEIMDRIQSVISSSSFIQYDKNLESSTTIVGSSGVKVGGQYMNNVEYCHINYLLPVLAASNPPNDYGTYQGSAANHHYIFENVVEMLHGDGKATTNAMEGLN